MQITCVSKGITPHKAKVLLKNNPMNRRLIHHDKHIMKILLVLGISLFFSDYAHAKIVDVHIDKASMNLNGTLGLVLNVYNSQIDPLDTQAWFAIFKKNRLCKYVLKFIVCPKFTRASEGVYFLEATQVETYELLKFDIDLMDLGIDESIKIKVCLMKENRYFINERWWSYYNEAFLCSNRVLVTL